jgi:hypothetical protein
LEEKMKKKKKKKKIDCRFKDEILKRKEVTSFLQSLGNQLSTSPTQNRYPIVRTSQAQAQAQREEKAPPLPLFSATLPCALATKKT